MFGIETVTEVTCTNSNPRRELHGPNPTRAIDISVKFQKPNEFLDEIEPGLRDHHYHNAAVAKSGQTPALAPELMPAPDLRFPKLNRRHQYGASGERVKGYTFVVDYGLGDDRSNITLQDCAVPPIHYTTSPDGMTEYEATIQYNGEELEDDATYGRLSGLATKGKIHVRLLPPAEAVVVKNKGWRSGKPDVTQPTDGGAPLLEGDHPSDGTEEHDDHPEGSPEAAFAATTEADNAQAPKRRGRRASLAVV